ncbi:MAG: hypothetical protein V4573_10345 [Pseudomonadota bacterium]
MPRLSRPALIISACIFVCALVMLCAAQLSKARVSPADLGAQAAVVSVQAADADAPIDGPMAEVSLADLSSELSEPMLPITVAMLPGMSVAQPAAPVAVALPHPLIEGPQRPPRALFA